MRDSVSKASVLTSPAWTKLWAWCKLVHGYKITLFQWLLNLELCEGEEENSLKWFAVFNSNCKLEISTRLDNWDGHKAQSGACWKEVQTSIVGREVPRGATPSLNSCKSKWIVYLQESKQILLPHGVTPSALNSLDELMWTLCSHFKVYYLENENTI